MTRTRLNIFIVSFLVFIVLETAPIEGKVIEQIRKWIDPVGDVTGLWQGRWDLFAPNIDKQNNWIEASVFFNDADAPIGWRSPDWNDSGCLSKFRKSREIEFYDRIRSRQNSAAWKSFAKYTASSISEKYPDRKIQKIDLFSVTQRIPPPKKHVEGPQPISRRKFYTYEALE